MRRPGWIALIILVVLIAVGGYFIVSHKSEPAAPIVETPVQVGPKRVVIGSSVEGRAIEAITYGTSTRNVLFVGGIHGGYEWNSTLLAYEFMDYLKANTDLYSGNLSITVIPALNPDGLFAVTGKEGRFAPEDVATSTKIQESGRLNGNNVDINRNFDCNWKADAVWKGKKVGAGTAAFTEPEAISLRDYIKESKPVAVIFWHSQSGAVYASACNGDPLEETLNIMNAYAEGSGYKPVESFDAYPVTGDSEGWLASIGIPAITVEFTNHTDTEWDKNLAGIKAVTDYFKMR